MGAQLGLRLAMTLRPRPTLGLPATGTCHIRTTGDRTRSLLLDRPVSARPVVNEAVSVLALDCLVSD